MVPQKHSLTHIDAAIFMHIQSHTEQERERERGYMMTCSDIQYGATGRPASRCREAALALRDWRNEGAGGMARRRWWRWTRGRSSV
eukprot:1106828-Rhodomonas_salina.1